MRLLFILIGFVFANNCISQDTLQSKKFSKDELISDFDFLFRKLEQIHPDLYCYRAKESIDKDREKVKAEIAQPMTRMEFARIIIPVVASLKDAHTSIPFPQEERADYLKNGGLIFPFDVRIQDNKIYIKSNFTSDTSIHINSEIIKINGIISDSILARTRNYISAELDFYRDIRIEKDFRRLLWYVFGFEDSFSLELKYKYTVYDKHVKGLTLKEFESTIEKYKLQNQKLFSYYQVKGTSTGVIDFRQMTEKDKFKIFLDSVFTVVRRDTIRNLVIDIRQNGGGNSQLADMLFSYITDKPYKLVEEMAIKASKESKKSFRNSFFKWYLYPLYPVGLFFPQSRLYLYGKNGKISNVKQTRMVHPHNIKLKFTGMTFLLTSHFTFSSAHMLAGAYKCYNMGVVIGEETGGVLTAFGDLIGVQLPNTRLYANCSHKKFIHPCNDGKVHGVIPDIEIKPTLEDISSGKDVAMEYILESVK